MLPLHKYARVKDRVCVAYSGECDEYVTLLAFARTFAERQLPGINLYVACRPKLAATFGPDARVIGLDRVTADPSQFSAVREIRCDMARHPVEIFFADAGVSVSGPRTAARPTRTCVISTVGTGATQSMTAAQIEAAKVMARGWDVRVNGDHRDAGWVIGVESVALFEAAVAGVETSLFPTGLGTALYAEWFPAGKTVKLW